jgi:hypothetical protein
MWKPQLVQLYLFSVYVSFISVFTTVRYRTPSCAKRYQCIPWHSAISNLRLLLLLLLLLISNHALAFLVVKFLKFMCISQYIHACYINNPLQQIKVHLAKSKNYEAPHYAIFFDHLELSSGRYKHALSNLFSRNFSLCSTKSPWSFQTRNAICVCG